MKRRRRYKQTTTLAQRLSQEAGRLRDRARQLPSGAEQTRLLRKVRQAETAMHIDQWLSSPEDIAPAGLTTLMGKSHKRRSSSKSLHRSA